MGLFKRLTEQNIMFTKQGEHEYKVVLSVESVKDSIIVTYLDGKNKQKLELTENSLNEYRFIEKTKNLFYKKYKNIDPSSLIKEMDTGGVGFGDAGSVFSGDTYAPGDARVPKAIGGMTRRNFPETITGSSKKTKKKTKKRTKKNGKKRKIKD